MVAFFVHKSMFASKPPTINQNNAGTQITLYRDYDSHFRIDGSINGIAVTFLIDTGSTSIAVPEVVAKAAGLIRLATVQSLTANGTAIGYFTRIKLLSLGPLEFENISATIIPTMGAGEVLLGMNILSKFDIQQDSSTLTLTVPDKPLTAK